MASLPPAPSLPLLGRAQDRETLARLLSEAREVDLVGPAGIGKSALALAVAREVAAAGQRVAWLDGVRDLVGQPSLAVIDGGDGEAPAVADVLRRAPEARVLRVARDAPRGEAAARLELGPLDEAAGVALLTRLLARDVPGPRASEPAWALAQIVESLDGVPLALVCVAPFVARLGAAVVAERAHEAPFLLLADALADAPAHHRSVARLFASSLGALPPGERTLLAEVGVFAGPFTPAQVDLVLGGASAMRTATLGVLARRGLLRVVVGGLASWALVRAALATEGPSDATRKRYAAFVRARAARDETLALVPDLARVAAGKDAQAAFEAAVLLGERAPGAVDGALAARLAPPAGASATWRARAARVRGRHAAQQGDWEKARRALSEALREAPPGLHAHLLCDLARGDPTEARALYARAAAGFRAVGDPRGEARVLGHVATLDLSEGALVSARRRFAEAAEAARRAGDLRLEGQVRQNLGLTLLEAGAHAEADAAFSDAVALHEEAGDARYQGIAALDRGLLRLAEARPRAALRLFDRAADAAEATADPESSALALAAAAEALAALAERRAAERRLRQAHAASRGFAEARLVIGVARGAR
ncbi:MAG: ATP-binding protein, partial [Myxococcota bacterium]